MRELTVSSDPSVMRLAHPIRLDAAVPNMVAWYEQLLGPEWPLLEKHLRDERFVLAEAGYRLTKEEHVPRLRSLVQMLGHVEGNTEQGGAYGMLSWLRYRMLKYTHFKFTDALVRLLEHTDLDDDVPVSYLLPPFSFSYLELGEHREVQTSILNELSGLHRLEGAYVERGAHRDYPDCLSITLTGSPLGHKDATDDATLTMVLSLEDLQAPLAEVLASAFWSQRALGRELGLTQSSEETAASALTALKLVAKALLYLGLPEARQTLHAERTQLAKAGALVKSGAKRAKLQRKMARAYDYVLVEPGRTERQPEESPGAETRTLKAHWRRGHYRMQAHGPQNSLRKLVFIRPTLIGGEEVERPAQYRVH